MVTLVLYHVGVVNINNTNAKAAAMSIWSGRDVTGVDVRGGGGGGDCSTW